ncbi:MAG: hypothetical protein E6J74_15175 [Deltaproteobacteria bacterium]|nr:MAG: hypothetical protein E6J74_15175 [Deltaproteobacteria bacterium]
MNKAEAMLILSRELRAFAARPYIKLVELISRPEVKSISTESGVNYQIELNVFWDSQPEKDLRIMGSIDDGGWRAFLPLTESVIMKPDGTLI